MNEPAAPWASLQRFAFGDNPSGSDPALADDLLALVLAGIKTATCWAASDGQSTHIGKQMVAVDSNGTPRVVLETVELNQRRFDTVDAGFAHDEGEGDRSLADWRRGHEEYFRQQGVFAPDMLLWCERFRVVMVLPA